MYNELSISRFDFRTSINNRYIFYCKGVKLLVYTNVHTNNNECKLVKKKSNTTKNNKVVLEIVVKEIMYSIVKYMYLKLGTSSYLLIFLYLSRWYF